MVQPRILLVEPSDRVLRSSRNAGHTLNIEQISRQKVTKPRRILPTTTKVTKSKVIQKTQSQTKERVCRLTKIRQKKIENFIRNVLTQPRKNHGEFGSTLWIKGLINYMKEPKKYRVTESVVRKWMRTTRFFEETFNKLKSLVPRELQTPIVTTPELFSSSSSDESTLESDDDCFIPKRRGKNGMGSSFKYPESVSTKHDWNARPRVLEEVKANGPNESNSELESNHETNSSRPTSSNSSINVNDVEQDQIYKNGGNGLFVSPGAGSNRSVYTSTNLDHEEQDQRSDKSGESGLFVNFEADGNRSTTSSNSSANVDHEEQDQMSENSGESGLSKISKMSRSSRSGQKAVVSIFPGGFEWKGSFGQFGNGAQMTATSSQSTDWGSFQQQQQQVSDQPQHIKNSLASNERYIENSDDIPTGKFVARIALRTPAPCFEDPGYDTIAQPESQERLANVHTISTKGEPVSMMGHPDLHGNSLPSFYIAEDIIAALLNSGSLVLHTGDVTSVPDAQGIPYSPPNDVTLLQLHANKILQIAVQNTQNAQDHPGLNWEAALHCGSLLNFIANKHL